MTIRLLIAEGDLAAARMLEASLVRYGFEVKHAADGEAAITAFHPRAFDVVLLDVSLAKKSGVEAARAIRTSPGGNQVGIVLTSGNTVSPDLVLELRRAQVDGWFNKPLSLRDLRDKLAEVAHKYTGATSELLHVESGRRVLSKTTKPAVSPAVAAAVTSEDAKTPPPAPTTSSPPPSRPVSGGVSRAAVAVATTTSGPASEAAPTTVRRAHADVPAAVATVAPAIGKTPGADAGFAAPPSTGSFERMASLGPPLGEEPQAVVEVHASARMMLALARSRVTGIYTLTHRDSEAKVAFIHGVMVGAMDTSTENRLLTRLVRRGVLAETDLDDVLQYSREHKLRAAEAVLALEHCDAETLLDELEQQAAARLVLAASWRAGEMRFISDKAEVGRLAISSFDAYEVLARRFDQLSDPIMVSAWLERAGDEEIKTSRDFEDGLVAYARVAPTSPLPGVLFSRPANLKAVEAQIGQWAPAEREKLLSHVYGMWVAGLLRLPSDTVVDERPVPRPIRSDEVDRAVPDKEACGMVRAEWLRAQGRNYYEVVGADRAVDQPTLWGAIAAYREKFGRETLGQRNIGPVEGLAEELWALFEDIETTLLDEDQRASYDASLAESEEPTSLELSIDADSHFLEGKLALSHGDIKAAKQAFELASGYAHDNPEYKSYLAWTEFLEGSALVESALSALREAASADPTAMRPVMLIGLAAERMGNVDAAREALEEAQRRAPAHPEVENALSRLKRERDDS